jgi:hypothetical protein
MLQDILEISNSPFLNPLSVVYKGNKKIKTCVDARKVKQYTVPDRHHTIPHPYKNYYKGPKGHSL